MKLQDVFSEWEFLNSDKDRLERSIEHPNSLWDATHYFVSKGCKIVAELLNADTHRWYIVYTNVLQCEDGFFGVRGVGTLLSGTMSYDDCNTSITIEEYQEVPSVTYKKKSKDEVGSTNM